MRRLALAALFASCAAPSAAHVSAPSHRPLGAEWRDFPTVPRTTTTRASRSKIVGGGERTYPPSTAPPTGAPTDGGSAVKAHVAAGGMEAPPPSSPDPNPVGGTTPPVSPCAGWRPLLARYAWDVDEACRVLMCESGGRADARNGRYAGLMQVDGGSFDPATNVAQAFAMWVRRGWSPWTCR